MGDEIMAFWNAPRTQENHQTVIAASESGSTDILVGEVAQQELARQAHPAN